MFNRLQELLMPHDSPGSLYRPQSMEQSEMADQALKQLNQARHAAERFIAERPIICLAAALTLGVLIGWYVKRK